jgi:hypothetical protein
MNVQIILAFTIVPVHIEQVLISIFIYPVSK